MKRFYLCLVLYMPMLLNAQVSLSLKNAIDTALKNNFEIQIARNYVEIANANNNLGMAGALPYVNGNVGNEIFSDNIYQKYNDGTENINPDLTGNSINAGITANMILFNGFKVIATKKKLEYLQQQSEVELNGQIQNTIADVMIKYYDIVRQQNYLRIIQSILDISQKKMDIINEKKNVGMANGVDIMQAQSDLNTAKQNLISQQLIINQAKADLLLLINAKLDESYTIDEKIVIDSTLVFESIINKLNQNPNLLSAEEQIKIYQQIEKETSAQRYPSLKLNTSYNFAKTDNNSGYTLLNQIYGPAAGLTLQIPIFNGNIYKTQKTVAELNVDNSILEKESLYKTLNTIAIKKFLSYSNTLEQITSQQTNFELAKKLLDLVLLNFQYGQATILELKAAQASYESAAYQLINFQYAGKIAEIELKQLIYELTY